MLNGICQRRAHNKLMRSPASKGFRVESEKNKINLRLKTFNLAPAISLLYSLLLKNQGLVEYNTTSFTSALRGNFKCATSNSAKSSGCKALSGLPSVSFRFIDNSVAIVLGIKVNTLIFSFLTSIISDSDK